MLQLYSNKYRNTYQASYYYANSSNNLECGDSGIRTQNHQYWFRSPSAMQHADLPLHMRGINLSRYHFEYDEDNELDRDTVNTNIKDKLLEVFNNATDDKCIFITCYLAGNSLENKDYNYEWLDTDLWTEHKGDSIEALFNKCVEQTSLRESERQSRNIQQHIRVFQSKAKHILLMLTDYADTDQESETFLAIGLVPILFEEWKEKFEPKEIDYFKCLVNRSQVKRISNVKPTNLFRELEDIEEYHNIERTIRYQTLFQRVAEARIRTAERDVSRYKSDAQNALQTYDNALKKITEYEIIIDKYREGTQDIVDELQTVAKAKGVYDLDNYNGDWLRIVLRVPLDYFDSDEAECAIRNYGDANVRRFIEDVFIEQKYKLYIRTEMYYAYTSEQSFQDFTSVSENDCKSCNALFNPHFQFYHCLGDYKPSLIKAMRDQDLTLFTNIGIAAARSMNFKDGAVCNRWFQWLSNAFTTDYYLQFKCLEKDGKLYTLGQWLNNNFTDEPTEPQVIEAEDL